MNSSSPIRILLSDCEPWRSFITFRQQRVSTNQKVCSRRDAQILRDFLKIGESEPPTTVLSKVCATFRIGVRIDPKIEKAQGMVIGNRSGEITILLSDRCSEARTQSLEAHEIAHVFFAMLHQKDVIDYEALEEYCWSFASELVCPMSTRLRWAVEFDDDEACFRFAHLSSIARNAKISIRLAISALDRHPLLGLLQAGIVIIRMVPNRFTGKDRDLRIWQCARPYWGYLPTNQSCRKRGFVGAYSFFDTGRHFQSVSIDENLCLLRKKFDLAKWTPDVFTSKCEYTCVDVQNEGRYLVAIWKWPSPIREPFV